MFLKQFEWRDTFETLMNINKAINSVVWGPVLLILVLGTGTYLSFMTDFSQLLK